MDLRFNDRKWVVSRLSAFVRNGVIAASPLLAKYKVVLNVRNWGGKPPLLSWPFYRNSDARM